MLLLKVIFALNMLSSKTTCYSIQQLQSHKQDVRSSTAIIHHMQTRMYVILCLGSPRSAHKHELYMLDSTAT